MNSQGESDRKGPKLRTINRKNEVLAPIAVENLIPLDHPARAIWQFVGKLDLTSFYQTIKTKEGSPGRPTFPPELMCSIWIFSYSEGVVSARKISKLCQYDPPYLWLTGGETINHHSLSDFRIQNKKALDELFVQTLGMLSAAGLITLERVMHDGTKISANAGRDSFRSEERLREYLNFARQQLEKLNNIKHDSTNPKVHGAKKRAAMERKERLEKALEELKDIRSHQRSETQREQARASTTDPEARIMRNGYGGFAPNYNVQVSTDSTAGVIIAIEATKSAVDIHELVPSISRIQANLGNAPKQVVVDAGFTSRENIGALDAMGITTIGSLPTGEAQLNAKLKRVGIDIEKFGYSAFSYSKKNDNYLCPRNKILQLSHIEHRCHTKTYVYVAQEKDCGKCPLKEGCCPSSKFRTLRRKLEDQVVVRFRKRMKTAEAIKIYKQRAPIAEFSNLWIKFKNGLTKFSLRGLIKVNYELVWVALTCNIQIWLRKHRESTRLLFAGS